MGTSRSSSQPVNHSWASSAWGEIRAGIGQNKPGVTMLTSRMLGTFRENEATRKEFLAMIGKSAGGYG